MFNCFGRNDNNNNIEYYRIVNTQFYLLVYYGNFRDSLESTQKLGITIGFVLGFDTRRVRKLEKNVTINTKLVLHWHIRYLSTICDG